MQSRTTELKGRRRPPAMPGLLKGLAITMFAVGGVLLNADLMAQPGVKITPIALPASDSGIRLALPKAAAVATPSAPDAWGGARRGDEATLSDRVANYTIEATLDPVKHTVDGHEKLSWRNRSTQEVRSVYLHLYMNAFESASSTFFSEKRHLDTGFRSGVETKDGEWGHIELRTVSQGGANVKWSFVHPDNGPETDHTVVRFELPAPVAAGASTTLDIRFFEQLPRVIARTGYFGSFHLVGQWFPKIGVLELAGERGALEPRWNVHEFHLNSEFFADFGNYDVKLTVPKGYTVGATGELQAPPSEKGGMVTHHYVQGDVHDFAWTADNRSAKALESSWTGPGSPPVKVSILFPPEYVASAAPAMKAAKDSLTYFSNTLGPYPYKTLTVVIPPHNATEAGGMEYPTFYTAEGFDEVTPGTISEFLSDFVNIHEFGHGYFYGILASNEFEEPMLDEGLNEYWDMRMLRERGQKIYPVGSLMKRLGIAPAWEMFDFERLAAPREEPADAPGQNAYDRVQGIGPIYNRTSTTMRDLEAHIGKDATERAFKTYYQRWKFRHPSVADLRETIAEVSGQRAVVEAVFAQQLYKASKIDDRISEFTSVAEKPQAGTAQVKGKWFEEKEDEVAKRIDGIEEKWDKAHPDAKEGSGPFLYRTSVTLRRRGAAVPQTLLVKFSDGSSETVFWNDDEKSTTFAWVRNSRAVSAELDPQRLHYLDASRLDNSRTIKAERSASRRWTFDIAAVWQILLSLIATI